MTAVVTDGAVTAGGRESPDQWSVAWRTVVVLAAAMSFADLFWVISLREAVGAVERTSDPFAQWVRESALLVPCYVLGVLGARHLVLPRSGATSVRAIPVVATALVVAALGTVVGVLALGVSSAYDYRLQMALLTHVSSHGSCLDDCLAAPRTATADLQLTSMGYGSAILLVTNLLLVAWLVALAGGRLRLSRRRRSTWTPRWSQLLAAGVAGTQLIHLAVLQEHIREWPAAGLFFAASVAAGTMVAAAVLRRPSSRMSALAAMAVCLIPLVIWLWSRTTGLPVGPTAGVSEPVGLADAAAAVLELGVILLVSSRIRADRRAERRSEPSRATARIALVAVVAVTAWGLGGSGMGWLDVTVADSTHPSQ